MCFVFVSWIFCLCGILIQLFLEGRIRILFFFAKSWIRIRPIFIRFPTRVIWPQAGPQKKITFFVTFFGYQSIVIHFLWMLTKLEEGEGGGLSGRTTSGVTLMSPWLWMLTSQDCHHAVKPFPSGYSLSGQSIPRPGDSIQC